MRKGRRRAWVIERRGPSLVTLTGSTGAGRPTFRDYGTEQRASEEMQLRIAERLADGWSLEDPDAKFEDGLGTPPGKKAVRYHSITEATGLLEEALRRHGATAPMAPFTTLISALKEFEKLKLRVREIGWWYEADTTKAGDVADIIVGRQIYTIDDSLTRIDIRLQIVLRDDLEGDAWYQERISVSDLVRAIGPSIRDSLIQSVDVESWD